MRKFNFIGYVNKLEHLNCSVNGNPRCYVSVSGAFGYGHLFGKTATDSSFGYGIQNHQDWARLFKCHETQSGNIIIDYVEDIATINEHEALLLVFDWEHGKKTDKGLFLIENSDGTFSAIDNTNFNCWCEDFTTKEKAINWLMNSNK